MEKKKEIMVLEKLIKNSVEFENELNNNSGIWSSLKTGLCNTKDSLIYNYVNRGTYFNYSEEKSVHLFNKEYFIYNDEGQTFFEHKFSKILYFSYRKNYPKQINYHDNSEYTSDCGWGCMIRSSQMILARAIYKILKKTTLTDRSLKLTLYYFLDYPINTNKFPTVLQYYYQKINSFLKLNKQKVNKKIFSPFSIRNICIAGELFELSCGQWFSDPKLVSIYDFLNTNLNIIPKLKIIKSVSLIKLETIMNKCFKPININQPISPEIERTIYNNKDYCFEYYGLIFISIRLGIYNISEEYYNSIKDLFSCKQFLGFIGGKDYAASYFIGFNSKNLLYIDPHYSQESVIPPIEDDNIKSYIEKILYQLPFDKLQPAFTIAFLFRDINEYNELINFFEKHNKLKYPCFSFQK